MELVCDNCGETFERPKRKVEGNDRVFCGLDCYHDAGPAGKSGDSRVTKECDGCGEEFKVYPYREDSARFCSKECAIDNIEPKTGSDHPNWKGDELEYTCQNCGDSFRQHGHAFPSKYCSKDCYREASKELFKGENNPVWRGGWEWYYGANWQEQRKKAIARDDHRCQDCGKPEYKMRRSPDVHHKKRIGWFREEYDNPEWWQKANRLDNLVTLCQPCHKKREWE